MEKSNTTSKFIPEFKQELGRLDAFYRDVISSRSSTKKLGPQLQIRVGELQDYIGTNCGEVNSKDNDGNAALHHCFAQEINPYSGSIAAYSLIINGANVRARNNEGKTPLELCEEALGRSEKNPVNSSILRHVLKRMRSSDLLRTKSNELSLQEGF